MIKHSCPKCRATMKQGVAIEPMRRLFDGIVIIPMSIPPITHDNLKMIPCWKCPKCGCSEYSDGRSCE